MLILRQNKTITESIVHSGTFEALVPSSPPGLVLPLSALLLCPLSPTTHLPLPARFLGLLDLVPSAHHSSPAVVEGGVSLPRDVTLSWKSQRLSPTQLAEWARKTDTEGPSRGAAGRGRDTTGQRCGERPRMADPEEASGFHK